MAEVVVPLGLAKAGFLSGYTVVLGIVAAAEERSENAKFVACVGADGGHSQDAPEDGVPVWRRRLGSSPAQGCCVRTHSLLTLSSSDR